MEEQIIINKTEKPNSYEIGKAGARWKLYFSDAEDLKKQIADLKKQGFEIGEEACTKGTATAGSS